MVINKRGMTKDLAVRFLKREWKICLLICFRSLRTSVWNGIKT